MAPISSISLLMGKAMIGVYRGLVSSVAFLSVALLIAPSMNVGFAFLLCLFFTCLVFSFLRVLAALLANTHEDMSTFSSLILLPMTFLGGTFFSVDQVPAALKIALYALPHTHSSICLRAAALDDVVPWPSFLAIIAFLLAFSLGSLAVLRRLSV